MNFTPDSLVTQILALGFPLVLAIVLHELAHGYAAKWQGDPTAEQAGRLTFNPMAHIDPIGTILVPGALVMMSWLSGGALSFLFGWAKPIPVNMYRLRHADRSMVLVAAAGPLSNLAMAIAWAILVQHSADESFTMLMAQYGLTINILLFCVNLFPLLPFDGGRIVYGFMPRNIKSMLLQIEPYGMIIFLGLMVTGLLRIFLSPLLFFTISLVSMIVEMTLPNVAF